MGGYINVGGSNNWRNLNSAYVYVGSTWKTVKQGYAYVSGQGWKQFYSYAIIPVVSAPSFYPIQISSSTSLRTSWTAVTPDSGYTMYYDLYRNTTGVAPTSTTIPTFPSLTRTSENNTGLTTNTTYYYWVRSWETNGSITPAKSAWVGPVQAQPNPAFDYLQLSASANSGGNGGFTGSIAYNNYAPANQGDIVVNLTVDTGTISPTSFIASSNTSGGSVSYTVSETSNTSYSATVTAKSEDNTVSATASSSYTYSSGGGGGSTTYYYAYSICNAGNGTYLNAPTNGGTVTSLPAITNPKTSPANPYYTANTVYTTTSSANSNTTIEYYSTISAADALSYVTNSACEVSSGGSGGGSTGGGSTGGGSTGGGSTGGGSTGGGTSGCSSFGSGQANACSSFRPVCTNGVCTTP